MKKLSLLIALVLGFISVFAQNQFTNNGNVHVFAGASMSFFGDFVNNGTFTDVSLSVSFNGTASQIISGTSPTTISNFVGNNATGITLQQDLTISNLLTLTLGGLSLNSHTITISNAASTAIARTGGYILSEQTNNAGKVKWNIGTNTSSHVFPFGTASAVYVPLTLQVTAGNIGNVTVSTYPTAANNIPYPTTPTAVTNLNRAGIDNSANVVDRFWQIDKDGPSGTATVTFSAAPSEIGTISSLQAQRWNSTTGFWDDPISGQSSGPTDVTVSGITTFSPWAMSGNNTPMPIELLSFTAEVKNYDVNLNWKTATEINNDYFIVQRSSDGKEFLDIAKVAAGVSKKSIQEYNHVDVDAPSGRSYYRLKQTDRDGSYEFSDTRKVDLDREALVQVTAWPNPVTNGEFSLNFQDALESPTSVMIYDLVGRLVFNKIINAGVKTEVMNLSGSVAGAYVVKTMNSKFSYQQTIILE